MNNTNNKKVVFLLLPSYLNKRTNTDILGGWFAECLPIGRFEKGVLSEELFKAFVTSITVTSLFTSVIEELTCVIKADATIHTHSVFELCHARPLFVPIFLIFQHITFFTVTLLIIHTHTIIIHSKYITINNPVFFLFVSIVKPHCCCHPRCCSHL